MAAPVKMYSHGTAPIRSVVDEGNPAVAVQVGEMSFEDNRKITKIDDEEEITRRVKATNPVLQMSLKGMVNAASGLAVVNTGNKLDSLANFTEPYNGYDPADGTIVVMKNSQKQGRINDNIEVDLQAEHLPYVISA